MNEATDKKAITKQVIIDTKYSSRLLPITADEKVIDIIQSALTELAEIKKRTEAHQYVLKLAIDFIDAHPEMLKQVILLKSANEKELEAVNYILKGEMK